MDPAAQKQQPLGAEARAEGHCEGLVVTCAHCGRPATECDGEDCAHVLETRDFMVPGFRTSDCAKDAG